MDPGSSRVQVTRSADLAQRGRGGARDTKVSARARSSCGQRAAPGGGAAATTLQKRTLWKSVISAVSWPWGLASAEKRPSQRSTALLPTWSDLASGSLVRPSIRQVPGLEPIPLTLRGPPKATHTLNTICTVGESLVLPDHSPSGLHPPNNLRC